MLVEPLPVRVQGQGVEGTETLIGGVDTEQATTVEFREGWEGRGAGKQRCPGSEEASVRKRHLIRDSRDRRRWRKGLLGCWTSPCKRWGLNPDCVDVCLGRSAGVRGSMWRDEPGAPGARPETGRAPESSAEPAKASEERSGRSRPASAMGLQVCREEREGGGGPTGGLHGGS